MPLEFASNERIVKHEVLAADFLDRIFGVQYDECFISDESTLWLFHDQDRNEALQKEILDVYGVDVSDIESGSIADILERIAARSQKTRD